ncbi:M protein, serotype 2.1-like isoform X1 [Lineus longissimus]|uniref:M protein, serotype 2.1-like isoform X1 n=1 Tax=Lineus longissimus TaxID=88925 RepID=UPI002B4F0EA1
MSADKVKKTFEFRMSKKVAELTQVVHMLFTRNHEKEVELEAQKEAYEYEIELVIRDAKSQIERLDMKIRELERSRNIEGEKARLQYGQEMQQRESELKAKLEEKEKELVEEKSECQHVRDLLINAQKDIEQLRRGVSSELDSKSDEVANKNKEIEKLRRSVEKTEKKLKDSERKSDEAIKDLSTDNDKLQKELSQLQELFEDNRKTKEQLISANKLLEIEIKKIRKELGKRLTEMVANQNGKGRGMVVTPLLDSFDVPRNPQDYNNELDRLRREVQRYKMELTNRDSNFNRVFTEFQPVVVDSRAGRIATQQQQIMSNTTNFGSPQSPHRREKTFAYATANSHSFDDEPLFFPPTRSASSMSTSTSRLPTLPTNQKVTKLMKPRPLSKELLSGKN